MPEPTRRLLIALNALNYEHLRTVRRREPVCLGVPVPRGAVRAVTDLEAVDPAGQPLPFSASVIDSWPDGSARWLRCELALDAEPGARTVATLSSRLADSPSGRPPEFLSVTPLGPGVRVDTGRLQADLTPGWAFPFGRLRADGSEAIKASASAFTLDVGHGPVEFEIARAEVLGVTEVRTIVQVHGRARGQAACPLELDARLEFFAQSASVRVHVTVRNPRRAQHPGGRWVLGDEGSVLIRSAICRLAPAGGLAAVDALVEPNVRLSNSVLPFELHQESSGGERWDSHVHVARSGKVPLRFRGYRVRTGGQEHSGLRAQPVLSVAGPAGSIAIAVPHFWQNFPQALFADAEWLTLSLMPADAAEPHELQGGEQKTYTFVVALGDETLTAESLAWVHEPMAIAPAPEWNASTGAVPFLTTSSTDPFPDYLQLVAAGLDPRVGFATKQERADEYGWRHFGDLPADHESARLPEGQHYVSHYNNQYDALAWFAIHFLRTADTRWHTLMSNLAGHVRDIDIYHTTGDKAAYNGGLFWHTDHYLDAATSTHRTYPLGSHGGGPSNEHNYNQGLLLHYLIAGDEQSRDAAIGLADWVLRMDDGEQTVFRWLARGATGLASQTGTPLYHGPGRGAANSIIACMVAHRLTGDGRFATKVDELIRRCIHPDDDLDAMQLDDVERRWYYTVFLQSLGQYLYEKWERQVFDEMFDYARACLLRYCDYIVEKEQPYLDRPERLEFPTETWAAQDLRKGDALLWAAFFAPDAASRTRYSAGAERFFDYAVAKLHSMPTHVYTRPTVLTLALGWRRAWFSLESAPEPMPFAPRPAGGWPGRIDFVPQKQVALRRAKAGAAGLALALAGGAIALALL